MDDPAADKTMQNSSSQASQPNSQVDSPLQQSGSGVVVYGTNFEVGSNYQIISPIGQGAYGVVVAARVKNLDSLPNVLDDGRPVNSANEEQKSQHLDSGDELNDEPAHEMVAIKKIMLQGSTAGMIRRTLREIKILRLLQHENCLTLLSVLPPPSREEFKELYLVTNLMPTNLQ